jgi:tetratricopeptide (TPR) repeat protein
MLGMHILPPWLEAPLLQLRVYATSSHQDNDNVATAGPEHAILQQLKALDAKHEPHKAYELHGAVGKLLRTADGKGDQAIQHLQAARDAASRTGDKDSLMSSILDLADAYIDQDRPSDSGKELAAASGLITDQDHSVHLQRGRGHTKFELGNPVSALRHFQAAAERADKPEDVVRIACDSAMVQTCLGHARKALEPLGEALDVLRASRRHANEIPELPTLPDDLHDTLAAEVHLRLAEAFHFLASQSQADETTISSASSAEKHYKKALLLQERTHSSKPSLVKETKRGLARLRASLEQDLTVVMKPSLHCPNKKRAPWDPVNRAEVESADFLENIKELLEDQKYEVASSELQTKLRAYSRPYKNLHAASALNMLAKIELLKGHASNAARHFRQALQAVQFSGESDDDACAQAEKAYKGLEALKEKLPAMEQRFVIAALDVYSDHAAAIGMPSFQISLDSKSGFLKRKEDNVINEDAAESAKAEQATVLF